MKKTIFITGLIFLAVAAFAQMGVSEISFTNPIHSKYKISMHFGKQIHPLTDKEYEHDGIDIVSKINTKVYPIAEGIVIEKGFDVSDGKYIVIDHKNGYKSRYTHLKSFSCEVSENVSPKKTIARLGATGIVTAPFLHLSIFKDEEAVDPESLIEF